MRRGAAHLGVVLAAAIALAAFAAVAPAAAGPAGTDSAELQAAFSATDDLAAPRGSSSGKDWRHTVQVIANLRARRPGLPVVILLGGSSAREATVDEDNWAAQIRRRGGPAVLTYNLASRHRTFPLDLRLTGLLPRRMPAIVYIGVNLGRFCNGPSSPRVRLPRPHFPLRLYHQHVYSIHKRTQSASVKRSYVQYWLAYRRPEFNAHVAHNLRVLDRLIRGCKRRGLHPVLLDLPRDTPIIGHSFDDVVGRYHAGCRRLAAKWHIPFLTFVSKARFTDGDFFDIFHTVEPGRRKYQRLLSEKTVRLLERYGMDEPTPTPTPTPSPSVSAVPTP